ncbi:hypothetical protein [Bradyrhizobium sp.]|uniref:hypothetical protein n=1 Tax=Bradyrhizobium sp. TaxID=376 RepID=UPI003C77B087
MRALFFLVTFLIGSAANAQQCPQCLAADACIREYLRDVSKLKVDHIKAIAAQRKDGQQTTPADQGTLSVQPDIDKLKDCLGKIR